MISSLTMSKKLKVGIVGYGNLGKYLTKEILSNPKVKKDFELGFVWNRSFEKITKINKTNSRLRSRKELKQVRNSECNGGSIRLT